MLFGLELWLNKNRILSSQQSKHSPRPTILYLSSKMQGPDRHHAEWVGIQLWSDQSLTSAEPWDYGMEITYQSEARPGYRNNDHWLLCHRHHTHIISEPNSLQLCMISEAHCVSGEVIQPAQGHTARAKIGWIQVCVLPSQYLPVLLGAL